MIKTSIKILIEANIKIYNDNLAYIHCKLKIKHEC